jgi:hypothetical protein
MEECSSGPAIGQAPDMAAGSQAVPSTGQPPPGSGSASDSPQKQQDSSLGIYQTNDFKMYAFKVGQRDPPSLSGTPHHGCVDRAAKPPGRPSSSGSNPRHPAALPQHASKAGSNLWWQWWLGSSDQPLNSTSCLPPHPRRCSLARAGMATPGRCAPLPTRVRRRAVGTFGSTITLASPAQI